MSTLGPTGRYPHGKISDDDQGEITIAVGEALDRVVIEFGTELKWIGLTPDVAEQLGQHLLNKAKALRLRQRARRSS